MFYPKESIRYNNPKVPLSIKWSEGKKKEKVTRPLYVHETKTLKNPKWSEMSCFLKPVEPAEKSGNEVTRVDSIETLQNFDLWNSWRTEVT